MATFVSTTTREQGYLDPHYELSQKILSKWNLKYVRLTMTMTTGMSKLRSSGSLLWKLELP